MPCKWIPLRIHIRSRNTQPHLKTQDMSSPRKKGKKERMLIHPAPLQQKKKANLLSPVIKLGIRLPRKKERNTGGAKKER